MAISWLTTIDVNSSAIETSTLTALWVLVNIRGFKSSPYCKGRQNNRHDVCYLILQERSIYEPQVDDTFAMYINPFLARPSLAVTLSRTDDMSMFSSENTSLPTRLASSQLCKRNPKCKAQ